MSKKRTPKGPMFEVVPYDNKGNECLGRWTIRYTKSHHPLNNGISTFSWELREQADAVCEYLNGPEPDIVWDEVSRISIEAYAKAKGLTVEEAEAL